MYPRACEETALPAVGGAVLIIYIYIYIYSLNSAYTTELERLGHRLHASIQGAPGWSRSHTPMLPSPLSATLTQNFDLNKAEGPFRRVQPEIAQPT